MFNKKSLVLSALGFIFSMSPIAHAQPSHGQYFDHAVFVIFENTNYADAANQPFFKQLGASGANFSNFTALAHPSQGNYVALTSGSLNGVKDDGRYDLNVENIADLLEAKGLTWKVYAEEFPGNCFVGKSSGGYARKHNPFISFVNIHSNPSRCANIVEASQFDIDAASGNLPNYVFYIPNNNNNGHDTGVKFADKWYGQKFSRYVSDKKFMSKTVLISTFDENGGGGNNQIYTSIVGPAVKPGIYNDTLNIFSLLNLVEVNWNLGDLGKQDATANQIPNIWQ